MKISAIYFVLLLLNISVYSGSVLGKDLMDELKTNNLRISIVGIQGINIWRSDDKYLKEVNINKAYDEMIVSPGFISKQNKILFAKNIISENRGILQISGIDDGEIRTIYSGEAIRSPIISYDNKKIAFLSNKGSNELYSLLVIDLHSMKHEIIINSDVVGDGYNYNISWMPNNEELLYAEENGTINIVNIITKKKRFVVRGYDPISSPDGNKIVFKKSNSKPYVPYIFHFKTEKIESIDCGKILNTCWTPNGQQIIIIKNISKLISWNEWEKEVSVYNLNTRGKIKLFKYEGFEYLSCDEF